MPKKSKIWGSYSFGNYLPTKVQEAFIHMSTSAGKFRTHTRVKCCTCKCRKISDTVKINFLVKCRKHDSYTSTSKYRCTCFFCSVLSVFIWCSKHLCRSCCCHNTCMQRIPQVVIILQITNSLVIKGMGRISTNCCETIVVCIVSEPDPHARVWFRD